MAAGLRPRAALCGLAMAAAGLLAPMAAQADPCEGGLPREGRRFTGQVRYVGDGDSLCVGGSADPRTWIEIRLADFYAPELSAPDGPAAKAALSRIALGRPVSCRAGRRSYDRVVARCTLKGRDLGELLRQAGVRQGGAGHAASPAR
jgi:micrococcal nuclease